MGRLEFFGLELLPVLSVDHPATIGLDMLPRRHRGRTAGDRYQVFSSFDLYSENGKAIFRVVEGDSFDQTIQVLGHRQVPASLAERVDDSTGFGVKPVECELDEGKDSTKPHAGFWYRRLAEFRDRLA
jgi:hypothetical protein